MPERPPRARRVGSLTEAVSALRAAPSGRWVAAGSASGELALVDEAGGDPRLVALPSTDGAITALAWHPDRDLLAAGTARGSVVVASIDQATHVVVRGLGFVGDLEWAPEPTADLLAVAGGSAVHLLGAAGSLLGCWPTFPGAVNAVAWADGPSPLAAGGTGGVRWLDVERPGTITTTFVADGAVTTLAADAARTRLAAGDLSGELRITDLVAGDELALDGYPDRHRLLGWVGDGLVVVADDEVSIWWLEGVDARQQEPLLLHGHDEPISSIASTGDGLVTGAYDGVVRRWWPGEEPPRACRLLEVGAEVRAVATTPGATIVGTETGELLRCGPGVPDDPGGSP